MAPKTNLEPLPAAKSTRRFAASQGARLLVPAVLAVLVLALAAVMIVIVLSLLGLFPGI